MEATRLCPYCLQPLPGAAQSCPHCGKSFAGRNPGGTLPVGTVLAGRYTVGEMLSIDGEGILYRGAENLGRFRVTIKEYLPITLTAERTAESTLRPKTGSEVLFKTTRMDFADLYRSIQRATIDSIETAIFSWEEKEIPSSQIGEIVMESLKKLDPVAYVRFASVYREFKDVNTFMDELKKILE